MTQSEYNQIQDILKDKPFQVRPRLVQFIKDVKIEEPKQTKPTRTSQQNNALHLGFQLIADALNGAGLDMRKVLKPEIAMDWNTMTVKEYLFKPVMKLMTLKESTTELDKTAEIDKVWETVMRFLMENHHIDYIDFPQKRLEEQMEDLGGYKTNAGRDVQGIEYPEYTGAPTI